MSEEFIKNVKPPMPERVSFAQVVKHPVTYALLIVTSLLWVAVWMFSSSNNSNLKAREEEIKRLREEKKSLAIELNGCATSKEDIYKALLLQQGINLKIEKKLDSIKVE